MASSPESRPSDGVKSLVASVLAGGFLLLTGVALRYSRLAPGMEANREWTKFRSRNARSGRFKSETEFDFSRSWGTPEEREARLRREQEMAWDAYDRQYTHAKYERWRTRWSYGFGHHGSAGGEQTHRSQAHAGQETGPDDYSSWRYWSETERAQWEQDRSASRDGSAGRSRRRHPFGRRGAFGAGPFGRRPATAEDDLYTLLGLDPPIGPARSPLTQLDIKNAFRREALKWHPDRHSGSSDGDGRAAASVRAAAEERFKRIVRAYEILGDANKRYQYDQGVRVDDIV